LTRCPPGWKRSTPGRGDQPIKLRIALQQQNPERFEQAVLDMSTPDHPKYGMHFQSHHEMKTMLLPSDNTVSTVTSWLRSSGISDIKQNADWINFQTTIGVANKLLSTNFYWYTNDHIHIRRLRTLKYSLPDAVAKHIFMIQPTTRFGQIRPQHIPYALKNFPKEAVRKLSLRGNFRPRLVDNCTSHNSPSCLKSLYNINYTADAQSGSKASVASFLQQYARYTDLAKFEQSIAPWAVGQNFTVIKFKGGEDDQTSAKGSMEANLDVQYITSIVSPLPIVVFSTGGLGPLVPDIAEPTQDDDTNEPYLDFLNGILEMNQSDLPQVISISYGEDEQVSKGHSFPRCSCSNSAANVASECSPTLCILRMQPILPASQPRRICPFFFGRFWGWVWMQIQ
jgi:tripeptidyl-peptidase I